jgi:hypothetical protein
VHPRVIGPLLLEPSGNLLGRPVPDEPVDDLAVKLGTLELANERSLAAASRGLALGADGRVRTISQSVPPELAADRRAGSAKVSRDLLAAESAGPHLRYHFAFFHAKLRHRWDSFRMAVVKSHHSKIPAIFLLHQSPRQLRFILDGAQPTAGYSSSGGFQSSSMTFPGFASKYQMPYWRRA